MRGPLTIFRDVFGRSRGPASSPRARLERLLRRPTPPTGVVAIAADGTRTETQPAYLGRADGVHMWSVVLPGPESHAAQLEVAMMPAHTGIAVTYLPTHLIGETPQARGDDPRSV